MVEDKTDKKQKKNKGVSANPFKRDNVYFSDTVDTDSFSLCLAPCKSISRVKNELQTVIDLMGPSTPQFLQSPSNDGDNELSVTSEPTNKSSEKSKSEEEPQEDYSQDATDKTVPPDITFQEDTDVSIVADKNSTSLDIPDFPQYVCPPPVLPANMIYNSECMCPQIANYIQHKGAASMPCVGAFQKEGKKLSRHKNLLYNIFKGLTEKSRDCDPGKCEYYTMNIKESRNDNSPPRRLIFDLVGDIPRHSYGMGDDYEDHFFNQSFRSTKTKDLKNFNNAQLTKDVLQNETSSGRKDSNLTTDKTSRKFNQRTTYADSNGATRVDVYYFDHGDSGYLKTTDSPPLVLTEHLAEKTEAYTTRFWAEIFGSLHIGVSFCISFVLQLFRFLLYSLFRPLTVGLVQLGTDYFLKPCITTLFNAIIQPPLICLYNICTSLRDICRPVAEGMGYFLREIAVIIRAFRIVDVRKEKIFEAVSNSEKKDKIENVKDGKLELA